MDKRQVAAEISGGQQVPGLPSAGQPIPGQLYNGQVPGLVQPTRSTSSLFPGVSQGTLTPLSTSGSTESPADAFQGSTQALFSESRVTTTTSGASLSPLSLRTSEISIPTNAVPTYSSNSNVTADNGSLGIGSIVGAAVGGVVGIVLLLFLLLIWRMRRKNKHGEKLLDDIFPYKEKVVRGPNDSPQVDKVANPFGAGAIYTRAREGVAGLPISNGDDPRAAAQSPSPHSSVYSDISDVSDDLPTPTIQPPVAAATSPTILRSAIKLAEPLIPELVPATGNQFSQSTGSSSIHHSSSPRSSRFTEED